MIIIGVDNGNANTKTQNHNFVSGLTQHDVRPPMARDLIYFDGHYYTLSEKRTVYKRDRTYDNNAYVLSLFAIAKEIVSRKLYTNEVMHIGLAVGLPPGHFGAGYKKYMDYYLQNNGEAKFMYNDRPFNIKIDEVMVFPQAYAAIATRPSDLKKYTVSYVIDIGGFTTDVLKLSNGKPDLSVNYSFPTGVITMNNTIINRVNTAFDASLEESQIYAVLFNKPNVVPEEIKDFIREEAQKYAEDIVFKLKEQGIDLKMTPAIFVGGGSLLIRPFIEKSNNVAMAEFVETTQANVVGYETLMKFAVNRKAQQ